MRPPSSSVARTVLPLALSLSCPCAGAASALEWPPVMPVTDAITPGSGACRHRTPSVRALDDCATTTVGSDGGDSGDGNGGDGAEGDLGGGGATDGDGSRGDGAIAPTVVLDIVRATEGELVFEGVGSHRGLDGDTSAGASAEPTLEFAADGAAGVRVLVNGSGVRFIVPTPGGDGAETQLTVPLPGR